MEKVVVERKIGDRTLTLETGRMGKLSDGACVARYGDTMVLATVNSAKAPDNIDFFPLTVDYREKTSAAGVIPGGFFKREGRPTTKEILASRIIDRSIRPMFPDGFKRDVQVLSQVLSTDRENDPDVVAAIASFAALALSSLPHGRSLGMVRIGLVEEKLQINPLWSVLQGPDNKLNLTIAGHGDAIMMVEAGAKEVTEQTMIEALELGHKWVKEIAAMIDELVAKAGKPKLEFTSPVRDQALVDAIEDEFGEELRSAPLTPGNKQTRNAATKAAKERAAAKFHAPHGGTEAETKAWNSNISEILSDIFKDAERQSILRGVRADGRDTKTVRPITIEVGVLPRVHGSVLFTRGETQALGVVTLGGTDDQQIIDGLMPEPRKRFLLHYSFPPFSVGEVKKQLAPGRREIGHGALAERGLECVLPTREEFPYTIRITSEILESNGSSSMASVCAGTLAMMDAGVPIKQPVAGIAMGLVMEGKRYAILTDILGSEDGCGDMDFKVVGTGRGITALQMDIKCDGLTREIMAEALEQARVGRKHILGVMLETLRRPRQELSPNAPRLESVKVPTEKIGLIIGPGGKNIRQLQETFECKISIEDGGLCTITGLNAEKVKACVEHVRAMTREVELGTLYEGRVTAIKEFGAFVEILPGQEGLVHVSELSDGFIRAVTDVVRIGDTLKVKVIAIDDFGKVKLSHKAVLLAERGGSAPAADGLEARPPEPRERQERGPRPERGDRPERGERPDRPERGERPELTDRPERGPRPDRGPGRPERFDRPERTDRPERGDRPERTDRPDRGDRPERFDRPDRPDRPERSDRPERFDRPERSHDRPERQERFDRPARNDRPERPARPEWQERDAARAEGTRAERSERPADRPFRAEREERGDRGGRPDRGDRFPREERHGRPDPMERPDRSERNAPEGDRGDRGGRMADRTERPPRSAPSDRAETSPAAERKHPEARDRDTRGSERFDRDTRSEGWRRERPARTDEPRPERTERGPERDSEGPEDRPVHPRSGEGRDRGRPAGREDRGERGRGRGRDDRPARGSMPMAEFGDGDQELNQPEARQPETRQPEDIGELESIDNVLGEAPRGRGDRGDRPRGPRRPRRD